MKATGWIIAGLVCLMAVSLTLPPAGQAESVTLRWKANPNSDMAGYHVYWGEQSRAYGPPMPVGNTTTCQLDGLNPGKTYFFAVTALDTSGNESGFSTEVFKAISTLDPDPAPPEALLAKISVVTGRAYTTASGLKVGDKCYIDSARTFTQVPSKVRDATYILTAHADRKRNTSKFLSFTVDRRVTVYVAHDDRLRLKPGWLLKFKDTGLNLRNSPRMSLFARTFAAGRVTLGGNAGTSTTNMYTVIVVPR